MSAHQPRWFVLELEVFEDNGHQQWRSFKDFCDGLGFDTSEERSPYHRPWVAEICGYDSRFTFRREFLDHKTDYSRANRVGSRGIYWVYTLERGCVYEVSERRSWTKTRRYFCRCDGDRLTELTEAEVREWLEARHRAEARVSP